MTAAESTVDVHTVYCDHHLWLQAWLRRRLGNAFDAADLAHDTFVRLINARRTSPLSGEPRAFLTHIAKHLVIDLWRRQDVERAYLQALAHLPEAQAPSPEARMLVLEALYRVEAMLRAMPPRTQAIFLLAQLDGLSYPQIAQQFDMPLVTVKRHMRRAFAACLTAA